MPRIGLPYVIALCALGLWCATRAGAAPVDDQQVCNKASGDIAVAACTRAIGSGRYSGRDLGKLHLTRAVARTEKKEYERALPDFDAAVRLDPSGMTFFNRGLANTMVKNYDRAIADHTEAMRLSEAYRPRVHGRGFAYFLAGRYDQAIADFDTSIRLDPKSGVGLFGRGISRLKKGDEGGNADIAAAEKVERGVAEDWSSMFNIALPAAAAPAQARPESKPPAQCAQAETHWKSAEDIKSIAVYEDHLARFPDCAFVALARARIEGLKK